MTFCTVPSLVSLTYARNRLLCSFYVLYVFYTICTSFCVICFCIFLFVCAHAAFCGVIKDNNNNKEEKYASIGSEYLFAPIGFETLGPMNTSACQLFANLGRKISASSDDREGAFLFCRELQCWCNAITLSCHVTPCQPLTAWTDELYPIVYYLNF